MQTGSIEHQGNITIPDGGTIGSASDTDAVSISAWIKVAVVSRIMPS